MPQTVLVIDDSPDTHDLLAVRLRPEGLLLHHVLDPESAVERVESLKPDLILLDIDMPNMTGFEVCQRLKMNGSTSGVPIIFLTGAADVHDKAQGFDRGARRARTASASDCARTSRRSISCVRAGQSP